jgi:DNA-binding FadR family transcriptional regulator
MIGQVQELQTVIDTPELSGRDNAEHIIEAGFGVMQYAYGLVENTFLEETLENFRPAISRTYFVALESYREEIGATAIFFHQLVSAAVNNDTERLQAVIRTFGEQQRERVLTILRKEANA